ncbi:hypothetical protein [uncultured Cyclobacterium sp.]|uniref:hypothetical protein n=1 Tax=uncultured Cyclobacterium sp. TaxID=453820 RepID=UPI0030ED5E77|tara:strand:- start:46121 stop:46849 length:729 start_codon:yes stop_codon:yes gene_type:complete
MIYLISNIIISLNLLLICNSEGRFNKNETVTESQIHFMPNDKLEKFATNKIIPKEIRALTLEALSYFPDLVDTKIDFQFKNNITGSVMQAQPKVGSLFFHQKDNRSYKIKISRFLFLEDNPIPIEELPDDVLLGWIGHELGHIQDYLNRSAFDLLGFGVKYYLSNDFVTKAEIAADSFAVAHGLGEKIIATKNFVLNHDQIPLAYKQKLEALYMSPGEILSMVDPVLDEDPEGENNTSDAMK